ALLSGALLGAPARLPSPHLKDAERAASGIAGGARALPLLGGYWEVYAVGALDPDRRLLPIPVQWDYQRTPFYLPALRRAEALVYIHLAGAPAPGPWLLQHGGLFRRADAPVQDYGRYRATPYTSVQEAAVAVTLVDPGRAFARCEAPARLAVRWERPLGRGSLFMNYEGAGWQLEPPDGSCRADLVEHSDGLREIRLEECSGVRALVFKDPKPRSPDGGCAAPEAVLVREDVL
ncbi:MAG TPA: hypothetical protein VEY30_10460, partial [Myxococcaceae bacterium]|nr:hypothetical protein [Myxococcaceae bacterium]